MALDDDKMKEITHKFMTKDDDDLGEHRVYAHEHRKQLRRVVLKKKLKERKLRIKEKLREQKIQKQLQKEFEEKRREEERRMKEEQKRTEKEASKERFKNRERLDEVPEAPKKLAKGHVDLGKDEIPKEYSLEAEQETPAHHIRAKIFGKAKQTAEASDVHKLKAEKEEEFKRKQEASAEQQQQSPHENKKPFVELACARCSKILRHGAKFCDHCGSNKIMKVEEEVKEETPKPKGSSWGMKLIKFFGWLIVILLVLGGLALIGFWVLLNYFDIKFV